MAIKAGLVGVNPKGVDKNGMPISSGGGVVSETQLTANGKQFHFAYDETSEKYGYKLDGAGDFIPFESTAGNIGLNIPNPTMEGVVYDDTKIEYVSGGYQTVVTETGIMLYSDIIFKGLLSSYGNTPVKFPFYGTSILGLYTTGTEEQIENWNTSQYSIGSYNTTKRQVSVDVDVRVYTRIVLICKVTLE